MNFVSEKELLKQREDNPEESSEPVDNRPLFNRLKEVRDKKQLEWEEEHSLQNQFVVTRGMDEGDADFLSQVNRIKEEQEARKRKEELELVRLAKEQTIIQAQEPAQDRLNRPQSSSVVKPSTSKQATLLSGLVRKRPHSSSTGSEGESKALAVAQSDLLPDNPEDEEPKKTNGGWPQKKFQTAQRSSHCTLVGILPGMTDYSDSSDEAESSSNSESLESELPLVAIYAGKGAPKEGQANAE